MTHTNHTFRLKGKSETKFLPNNEQRSTVNVNVLQTVVTLLPFAAMLPILYVVFAGATTGIGLCVADALANVLNNYGQKLCIYIAGRNASGAKAVISKVKQRSPRSNNWSAEEMWSVLDKGHSAFRYFCCSSEHHSHNWMASG